MPFPAFERPQLVPLIAIAPALVVVLVVASAGLRRRALAAFGRSARLHSTSGLRLAAKALLLAIAATAIAVTLAGPRVALEERRATQQAMDVVIALDVSQSMAARDVSPDRLRAARKDVEALGIDLAGARVGLVLFAGDAIVRYPLTTDTKVLRAVLDHSDKQFKPSEGSSLQGAADAAADIFAEEPSSSARAVVLVSDGDDASAPLDLARLRRLGVRVFALGVGTPEGARVPVYDVDGKLAGTLTGSNGAPLTSRLGESRLRLAAETGGGRYLRLTTDGRAERELADALRGLSRGEAISEVRLLPGEQYQPFLALALVALLLEFVLGTRRAMPRPVAA